MVDSRRRRGPRVGEPSLRGARRALVPTLRAIDYRLSTTDYYSFPTAPSVGAGLTTADGDTVAGVVARVLNRMRPAAPPPPPLPALDPAARPFPGVLPEPRPSAVPPFPPAPA